MQSVAVRSQLLTDRSVRPTVTDKKVASTPELQTETTSPTERSKRDLQSHAKSHLNRRLTPVLRTERARHRTVR